eukprot:scaffold320_cov362-Prasinococcus_capsulatus_cf.AAC.4
MLKATVDDRSQQFRLQQEVTETNRVDSDIAPSSEQGELGAEQGGEQACAIAVVWPGVVRGGALCSPLPAPQITDLSSAAHPPRPQRHARPSRSSWQTSARGTPGRSMLEGRCGGRGVRPTPRRGAQEPGQWARVFAPWSISRKTPGGPSPMGPCGAT